MDSILVTLSTTVAFVAMILLLTTRSKITGRLSGALIATTAICGLLLYGYGFAYTTEDLPLAVIRALFAVLGMFLGKTDLSSIEDTPLMQHTWAQVLFWLLHLLALYIIASAAIVAVGSEALKKIRLWMARRGHLHLIYGVNDDTLRLGKQLAHQKGNAVVFVSPSGSAAGAITDFGGVLRTDADALAGNRKLLRSMGLNARGRHITLYALSKDSSDNIRYAHALLEGLQQQGIQPEKTRLVILCQEDRAIQHLQITRDSYGYGYVSAINEAELAARLLVRNHPPCRHLDFDEDYRAREDFTAMVIGFGQTAQAVLKHLVMNGQFEGSHFHAAVFALNCKDVDGYFASNFAALLEQYDIAFYPHDARSRAMTQYLQENGNKLRYVAICTGSEVLNHEIAEALCSHFSRRQQRIPVYTCSRKGVKAYAADGTVQYQDDLYQPQLLNMQQLDQMAMALNHQYHQPSSRSALENWMDCDYFSRQSCRAAADFADALLRSRVLSLDEAESFTPAQLLNLSKTEHMRWCAFHYCMGFNAMTDEEFQSRADEYRRQLKETGKATVRITKNMADRTHACLVHWDELPALGEKEAAVTGRYVNYQDMDTENVLLYPQLFKTAQ